MEETRTHTGFVDVMEGLVKPLMFHPSLFRAITLFSFILAGNLCLHSYALAQFSPSDVLRYVDDKGIKRSDVLIGAELNGMRVSAYEFKLSMSLDQAMRHLSSVLDQSQAFHLQHDELPINLVHWSHNHTSISLLLAQVDRDQTVGLVSTLDPNPHKASPMNSSVIKSDRHMIELPNSYVRELERLGQKKLFTFLDQQYLAGFVDVGSIEQTTKKYHNLFKANSWLPLTANHDCQVDSHPHRIIQIRDHSPQSCWQIMTKDGITMEVNHLFTGNHTLTLISAKSSG